MTDDKKAEDLLRAFYSREVQADSAARAARRTSRSAVQEIPIQRMAKRNWQSFRMLLAAVACLAIMAASSFAAGHEGLGPEGFIILSSELARVANEGGLFIPLRTVLPIEQ